VLSDRHSGAPLSASLVALTVRTKLLLESRLMRMESKVMATSLSPAEKAADIDDDRGDLAILAEDEVVDVADGLVGGIELVYVADHGSTTVSSA